MGRIKANQEFEQKLEGQLTEAQEKRQKNAPVLRMMRLYIGVVKDGRLTPRKKKTDQVYSWANDTELDRMLALNKKINNGATLQSLRQDFAAKDEAMHQKYDAAQEEKHDLQFALDLKEKGARSMIVPSVHTHRSILSVKLCFYYKSSASERLDLCILLIWMKSA